MARTATPGTALTLRLLPPADFKGTAMQWRVLTESIWPGAKTSEAVQLALAYCAARHLDPFKRSVHIVSTYNSALRREVETVWPGINELLTTAARSHNFAGVDEPDWGPDQTRIFEGVEGERREPVSVQISFPIWCSVRVWRVVQGERRAFSQPVYWMESYGRRAFRSELPNSMWEKRPRGQLHKCALAAALRLGFPEDLGSEYAAEEMEGREIDHGGVVIDGSAEPPAATRRPPPNATPAPSGEVADGLPELEVQDKDEWLKALLRLVEAAPHLDALHDIAGHHTVVKALKLADAGFRVQINEALAKAHQRLAPSADDATPPAGEVWPDDPIGELLAEIEAMDLEALQTLPSSAAWKVKLRDLFPPDQDRVADAVRDRIAVLRSEGGTR